MLDGTAIQGISPIIGYINGLEEGPENIAKIIIKIIHSNELLAKKSTSDRSTKCLMTVDWRITSECDHSCRCCFGPKGIPYLNLENAKKVIDILFEEGVNTVCISGGEPLTYPHIDNILTYI